MCLSELKETAGHFLKHCKKENKKRLKMKILGGIKALLIIIILIAFNINSYPQVVVERSKEKVILSGVAYYVHVVKTGESAFVISKAYGITVEELTKENPPVLYGIKVGQSLRIPVKPGSEPKPSAPASVPASVPASAPPAVPPTTSAPATTPEKKQTENSKLLYHVLKPGETVYFLSKTYGVTVNEIIQSNPGIDITKLSVGAEIAVPRKVLIDTRQKFEEKENKFIYHKVVKGESLSSIAEKYGITLKELKKENSDMGFPQVGDFIKIPGVKTVVIREAEPDKIDTVAELPEKPVLIKSNQVVTPPFKELRGSMDIAVMLPFYLNENSDRGSVDSSKTVAGKKIYKENYRPQDWIYPGSLDFVEMYEGILLAADTLRSLGLDINIYSYDIKSDSVELTRLIKSGKLADMELIIGPVYSHNLSIVAAYARNLGIPVVSPVPLFNNSALRKNPTLFMANSSLEIAQRTLAKKLSEFPDKNFVFIHSDSIGNDADVKRFKNLIFKELSAKVPYDEIKFKEFIFYSRSMFDNDSINRLSHALSEKTGNIVIIASEEAPVISETIMDVHGLSRKYDVKVFGYPAMRDNDNLDPKYFFDLDILVYSPSSIDYTMNDVKKFNSAFREKFLTEPSEKSYAWQGYDIAYYFMSGIALHGKNFITHPEIHTPDLLQTDYNFKRSDTGDGFENQKLFLFRYTKDYEVKLVKESFLL
jgi:LysM repeat protein